MTDIEPKALFDFAARGRLFATNGLIRTRLPKAAALADALGSRLVRRCDSLLPDRRCIERQYRSFVGEPLNLEQPRLLGEKVQWLKLHDVTPLHTICADKIRAREFVRERVGDEHLIPALLVSDTPDDVNPDTIRAERFAAKCNHDWGGVVLCQDRERFDWTAARAKLSRHFRTPFWKMFRERAYKGIVPGIIVETLLQSADGGLPRDYKFFCFHGEPVMIQVVDGRGGSPTWTMYDLDWTILPIRRRGRPRSDTAHDQPESLARMLDIAAALSTPFRFCRVDLYDAGGRIYFGEIAFYPEAGYRPFEPLEIERELGDRLRLD